MSYLCPVCKCPVGLSARLCVHCELLEPNERDFVRLITDTYNKVYLGGGLDRNPISDFIKLLESEQVIDAIRRRKE